MSHDCHMTHPQDCDAVALRCHLAVLRVIQSVVSLRQLKQELALTSQGDGSTALLDGLLALARLLVTASELPILEVRVCVCVWVCVSVGGCGCGREC